MGVFDAYKREVYPFRFRGRIRVGDFHGGIPADPKVAEGWLRSKLAGKDDLIRQMIAEIMVSDGVDAEEAARRADARKHLNRFKRDEDGVLYYEGRQLKAAIKEAGNIAVTAKQLKKTGWGTTQKQLKSFLGEHVIVLDDRLSLGVSEPSGVMQRFVHTRNGNGIQYEEFVLGAEFSFTVITSLPLEPREWAVLWTVGQMQGLGATRSMGYGRYEVIEWEEEAWPAD